MSGDVRVLTADEVRQLRYELAEVLADCVDHGASVGFLPPVRPERGAAFWSDRAGEVAEGLAVVLAATVDGRVAGTVQLQLARSQNQPHRADVAKLLVHSRVRRHGVGAALMTAVEAIAVQRGRWLLVLDTLVGSDASRLYRRLGWHEAGVIPDYALLPDGTVAGTTVFWKRLVEPRPSPPVA